ncbi:putative cytochrome P450 oxidoreductase [Aspergillus pseudotamarii]|uniref:Putative cytochrome P450 oxidoreductase n=1 Tax=Aspergillus pseudotamarii TaxID=132259 RepID=A0A5N6TC06_ASPPS|nr:putative cytochrome P450 oxidoreductase [Aspergillus pseudotamarii]KAE8143661.1 putative cytochrome P450 oxidoreductase [Aspergillus pseudotamarii]
MYMLSLNYLPSIAVALLLFILCYIFKRAYPNPYPGIPYNTSSARKFWGDSSGLLDAVKITEDPAKFIFQQSRKLHSPVIQLFFAPFSNPTIIIDDVREVKDILSNRTHEFDRAPRTQDAYRSLLPHCSLVKATGPAFKHQRRFWEGVTGTPFLRRVAEPKMYRCALGLIDLLRAQAEMAGGRPFYCFDDFDVAAFELIWELVFGTNVNSISNARDKVLCAASGTVQPPSLDSLARIPVIQKPDMCEAVSFFIGTVAKSLKSVSQTWHLWYLRQQPAYKRKLAFKKRTIDGLIESTRSKLAGLSEGQLMELEESSALATGVRRQLLAHIRQGQPVNVPFPASVQAEIHDELFMLLVAGHETKAVLLSWSVKFLVANPEKQEKLRNALVDAFPKGLNGEQPSMKAIMSTSIPYLEAYMEESMRVANTSPRLVRTTTTETRVLGYSIPNGATVLLNPYIGTQPLDIPEHLRSETSRNSKGNFESYWDMSGMDDFQPERWLAEDGSFNPRQFPRLAFSAGPRMCYGRNLALTEFRVNLVLLVLNFKFEPLPKGLDSMESQQRLFRMPRQCYVRLSPL